MTEEKYYIVSKLKKRQTTANLSGLINIMNT